MPCVAVEVRLVSCVVLCYVVFYCFLSFMLCALFNALMLEPCVLLLIKEFTICILSFS